MKKFRGTIYNWEFSNGVIRGRFLALPDEDRFGQGFHPGENPSIRTSLVVVITHNEKGELIAETLNSKYKLVDKRVPS